MSSTEQASSPSNFQLIIDALADYAKQTGIDLSKCSFAQRLEDSTSPQANLKLLEEREKSFKEYRDRNQGLISCISPAVEVLHAFSGTLGEVVDLVPFPPAKAVFVGIDALLSAASGTTSSYDALMDLFECLGNFLKRLEIYTAIPPTSMMTNIIVKIMVELLSVLALATKQIKQGRLKKFTKKLLGESEVESVLTRLDRLTEEEARMTVAQTLGVVHGLVGNVKVVMEDGKASTSIIQRDLVAIHETLNEMNKMKRIQLQRDVQHWLSPPDPSTNHDFVSNSHHEGTAAWFLGSDTFKKWKATGSMLWIHGKPGAGKSTLLSTIIQDIQSMHTAGLATMAYYYFDFRDVRKQDRYGLLSSLLFQLSSESDSCYEVLSKLYVENASGARKPTRSALSKCLKDMLSLRGQSKIFIIVDALDECPNLSGTPSAREEVLELIEELVDLQLPNVHLCVTSRPEIDIRTVLEPLTSLKISLHDEIGQKEYILEYIKSVIYSDRRMRRWKEEDKELVVNTLSDKADGMFRWVVCQVDTLRRSFPASIRSALNDLPKTLDETYGRTLLGIDQEKREFAQRLFQCLMVSIRPLQVEELAEILAFQFHKEGPPTFNAAWRPEDAEEAVMSACSSLVVIVQRKDRKVVQFSHFSAKEFLTSERLATAEERLSYYYIIPEPAHTILAHASLGVLLQLDDKIDRNAIISHFPLALYAARHWIDHAQFGNVSAQTRIQYVMEGLFDAAKPHFSAWVWLYDIDRHWIKPMSEIRPARPEAMPLYYASLCGFRSLVEQLIVAHSSDVNCRGGFHVTPLHAASVKGHSEVASLLLGNGADPNSRDSSGRVPLHRVSQGGRLVMVRSSIEIARVLINSGANVNATDDGGRTPLHAAARNGYRDTAGLLLGSGASLDARSDLQQTPLYLACDSGKFEVSRFLVDSGADLNCRDKEDFTLLHTASEKGHVDVARLLIDHGADVNVCMTNGRIPLHIASRYGYLDVTRLLIDNGAVVHGTDGNGDTPFRHASRSGHLPIAKFLLERGVDVDIRNGNEQTSLHLASGNGRLDVVRFLIEHGADINVRDNKAWNPLHDASYCEHVEVIRLFLDSGIPIDIRNDAQETPFVLAAIRGKVEAGRFLIEQGADINMRDNEGWVPLHFASRHRQFDMVRLLLDHGIDANIQMDDLRTPLHLASAYGHLKVVQLLIERGARVDVFNDKHETTLDRAAGNGKVETTRLLIDNGANLHTTDSDGWTPLHSASHGGYLGVVKLLLRRGADVDVVNNAGKTVAELASENGKAEVTTFLAEYKADENVQHNTRSNTMQYDADEGGKDGETISLTAASEEGNLEMVKLLLEQGADINSRNEENETPLDRAAAMGHIGVLQLLIERGAEVDARDKRGWTPLHCASRYGHVKVAQVLVDHGANMNAREEDNWTPIYVSARNGHIEIVKALLESGAEVHVLNDEGQTPYEVSLQHGYRQIADLLRGHGAGGESF